MAQAPVMPVFTDALIGDTTHLSTEQFGAYVLILIATWRNNGKPLPDDDEQLAHVCRLGVRRWRRKVRPVVQLFFTLTDSNWRQQRLEKEWNRVSKCLSGHRSAGQAGGLATRARAVNHEPYNPPKSPHEGGRGFKNGKDKEKEPSYGPLRDPTEIARDLGLPK